MDTRASTRTRISVLPVFIALLLNLVAGPLAPVNPLTGQGPDTTALAADAVVTQAEDASGCMGVVTTPGSENTDKRLISGNLEPGGTATFEISFPVDAEDVGGDFRITDCVFIDTDGDGDTEEGEAVAKYFIDFVPNNENFLLTFTLNIPADAPIGDEYCNFAKTTESPSQSQASNRKAGPACFVIGGAIRVSKVDQAGAPLPDATFSVSCTFPTTTSALAATIIGAPDDGSVTDGNDANSTNDATESYTSTSGGVLNVTAVTGSDGIVSVNAPVGTSCTFTETAAPDGYLPPAPPANTVTLVVPGSGSPAATHTFVNTAVMPDVVVSKSASQTTVLAPFSGLVYTITASNTGNGAANAVVISDNLDDDLVVTSATWDNDPGTAGGTGTCTVGAGNVISCSVGNLAASDGNTTGAEPDVATASITVDVPVAACPSVSNTSSVAATNEGATEQGNNSSNTVNVTVNCPDASVVKTATEPTIIGGDTASFSITVDGGTLGAASAVTLSDVLPAGFTWTVGGADIGDCSAGGSALTAGDTVAGGATLSCDFGPLAADEDKTITLSATTTLEVCEATISNTATISVAGDTVASNNTSTATITVDCPDASVVKDAVDATIDAGGDAAFTVVVTAGGSGDSTNVVLTDENPADSGRTWTISGDDAADCADLEIAPGETLSCDFGDIANGETRTITITTPSSAEDCADGIANTADITADDDVDETNNSDSASITVDCPDLSLDKSASSLTVLAPDTLEYVIFVSSDGDGVADNAVISDDLDDDLSIVGSVEYDLGDDGTTDGSCTVSAGNVIECELGDLAAGATASVTITVTVPSTACADDLTNTASVAADNESADDLENNSDTVNVQVDCPDVSVLKTSTDPVISSTESASFSITVDAGTLGTATDVTLSDSLPAGFTWTVGGADIGDCWIGADPTPLAAGDEVAGGSTLNCNFGPLGADETRTISLSADTAETDCDLTITNTATVSADGDTATSNNSSTATVKVQCPDINVDKLADDELVSAGEMIGFSIEVENSSVLGTGTAFDVTLDDALPGGAGIDWGIDYVIINGVEAGDPSDFCSIAGTPTDESLECDFGDMDAGDNAIVHVSSETTSASCTTYDNEAVADAFNHGQVTSVTATVTVECPGLNFTKTADADPIDAGEEASFTLTVWNNGGESGDAEAFDVTLHDDLPAGLQWDFEVVSGDATEADCMVASSVVDGGVEQMSIDCDFGTLGVTDPAGGIVIRVFADTTRDDCGTLLNEAWADASNDDRIDADATIEVKCPTIDLDKTNDAVGSVLPGSTVTYTLTLTVDDGPANDVEVVDVMPDGLESPTDISDGGVFDATDGSISWSLGDLADGTYTLTYQAVVSEGAENGDELVNVAAATSPNSQCPDLETLGPDCEDDSTVTVRVPILVIDKVASTELITITGPDDALVATPSVVTWTLSWTLTDGPVTNAVITDEVPVGFEFLDASDGGVLVDGAVTWSFSTLSESGSVTFRTTVDPETISRAAPTVNVAVIESDQTPEDEGEDSVRVTQEGELGGNPTPTPKPSLPNTATGTGINGEPITVPIELLAFLFIGSLGALALANVKARNRRR